MTPATAPKFHFTTAKPITASPVIATHPLSQTVNVSGNLTLSVTASGDGLTYQWQKDGVDIAGATSASYAITNAQAATAGTYRCVMTNPGGNNTSNG